MTGLLIAAAGVFSVASAQITGGFGDSDPNDKDVRAAAAFAVKKLGTDESATISLVRIEKVRTQVVAGLNFELCMEVNVKRGAKKAVRRYVKAVVYRDLKNRFSLSRWSLSTDPPECGDSER
jgi:hypothetical protein